MFRKLGVSQSRTGEREDAVSATALAVVSFKRKPDQGLGWEGGLRWRISPSPTLKGILGEGSGEGTSVPDTSDSCHENMLTC